MLAIQGLGGVEGATRAVLEQVGYDGDDTDQIVARVRQVADETSTVEQFTGRLGGEVLIESGSLFPEIRDSILRLLGSHGTPSMAKTIYRGLGGK